MEQLINTCWQTRADSPQIPSRGRRRFRREKDGFPEVAGAEGRRLSGFEAGEDRDHADAPGCPGLPKPQENGETQQVQDGPENGRSWRSEWS